MVKKIKFNLSVNGNSISDFEQLQENFSADLINHIENQKLSKWFSVRDMDDKAQQVSNIDPNSSPMEQLKALCLLLDLEADDDILTYLLEENEARQKEQTNRQEQAISKKTSADEHAELDDTEESENNQKGEDWSGWDLSGRDFAGADLRGYNLSGANLSYANLTDANLSGCDLSKAILANAKLDNADFTYCNLREAEITGTSGVKGPNFSNAILDKAVLTGDFSNANFTSVHAHKIEASDARFERFGAFGIFNSSTMKDADFSFSTFSCHISEEQKKEAKFFGVKFE